MRKTVFTLAICSSAVAVSISAAADADPATMVCSLQDYPGKVAFYSKVSSITMRTSIVQAQNVADFRAAIVKRTGNPAYLERGGASCIFYRNKDVAYVTQRLELEKRGDGREGLVGTDIDYTPQNEKP